MTDHRRREFEAKRAAFRADVVYAAEKFWLSDEAFMDWAREKIWELTRLDIETNSLYEENIDE